MEEIWQRAFAANRAVWDGRAGVHRADATGFYRVAPFLAGEDVLYPIEAGEIGDVAGLDIAHLQCHIGLDSICLARRGARVTGLDFSAASIMQARRLNALAAAKVRFVEGNVYDAHALLGGSFDMVYTTWGTTMWLPDINGWAKAAAALLKPGGRFYFADCHPGILCRDMVDGRLVLARQQRTPAGRPLVGASDVSYTGAAVASGTTYEWIHPLEDILSALQAAGLVPTMIADHDVLPWRQFEEMVPAGERLYRLPAGCRRLPLSVSIKAAKAAM
jgi:SAM-dependent methyltransferase